MQRTIAVAPVRQEIRVQAAPARAFEVFAAQMGRWWTPTHSINASPLKDVVIEARDGGRWFEVGEDGSECEWGKVLVWDPPSRLLLAWQISADWQYDANLVTELEVRFVPDGERLTRVELEHRNLERYGDRAEAIRASLASPDGWAGLFERYGELFAGEPTATQSPGQPPAQAARFRP